LLALLQDPDTANEIGRRAKEVFAAESGATARAVEALLALLPGGAA
jgi:hypothetical protein